MRVQVQDKAELGNEVLRGVSRSFYLSIRILPRLMREPIALGYLLARASDTIADTEEVPAKLREMCLRKFIPALKDKVQREELLEQIRSEFIEYQTKHDEKILLKRLGDIYGWYDSVIEWAWHAIAKVLGHIIDGQMNDIRHFAIRGKGMMESDDALETYCYQVAGSVGEFWSVVGHEACSRYSSFPQHELERLGCEYGKGLQLVNILRDLPKDLANGRCYLTVQDAGNVKEIMKASEKWCEIARGYLKSGIDYSRSLRQWRARVATVLPALLAEKTLDLISAADWDQLKAGVKVDRKEVRKCLWRAVVFR